MARPAGDSLARAHWWQKRPMVALIVGWATIGALCVAALSAVGPVLALYLPA